MISHDEVKQRPNGLFMISRSETYFTLLCLDQAPFLLLRQTDFKRWLAAEVRRVIKDICHLLNSHLGLYLFVSQTEKYLQPRIQRRYEYVVDTLSKVFEDDGCSLLRS